MTAGAVAIKILEPGRVAPTAEMLDAIVAGDLEAGFTWSVYAASKAPVFNIFATVPFWAGPGRDGFLDARGDGSRIHREAYEKLGVTGIPCGIQGHKGGGWFRGEVNSVPTSRAALRYGKLAAEVIARASAPSSCAAAGEFFYKLQQGNVDGGEMSTPAMDAALGFDKLASLITCRLAAALGRARLLMRKDKWAACGVAARTDPDRLPGEHRLDAQPLANVLGVALEKLKGRGSKCANGRRTCWPPSAGTARSWSRIWPNAMPTSRRRWPTSGPSSPRGAHWRSLSRLRNRRLARSPVGQFSP